MASYPVNYRRKALVLAIGPFDDAKDESEVALPAAVNAEKIRSALEYVDFDVHEKVGRITKKDINEQINAFLANTSELQDLDMICLTISTHGNSSEEGQVFTCSGN